MNSMTIMPFYVPATVIEALIAVLAAGAILYYIFSRSDDEDSNKD